MGAHDLPDMYVLSPWACVPWTSGISGRAVVSREAKKKQQACAYTGQCNHYSELFTQMDGLNF